MRHLLIHLLQMLRFEWYICYNIAHLQIHLLRAQHFECGTCNFSRSMCRVLNATPAIVPPQGLDWYHGLLLAARNNQWQPLQCRMALRRQIVYHCNCILNPWVEAKYISSSPRRKCRDKSRRTSPKWQGSRCQKLL